MSYAIKTPRCWRWTLLLGVALPLAACAHSAAGASPRESVERGLLPAIVISGRSVPDWDVDERTVRYHVPGVSIAVINDGKIEWAKGTA